MIKFLGSIIVIVSLTLVGWLASNRVSKKISYIRSIIEMLEFIKSNILYNKTTILKLFTIMSKRDNFLELPFLDNFYSDMKSGKSVKDSWQQSIDLSNLRNILDNEEYEYIAKIGNWLGNSSMDGQIANINLTIEVLKQRLTIIKEYELKYNKIYKNFGFLFGLAMVILIW